MASWYTWCPLLVESFNATGAGGTMAEEMTITYEGWVRQ
jgi:hypothetical protein